MNQRAAQPELLLHPAGEFPRRSFGEGKQPRDPHELVDPSTPTIVRLGVEPGEKVDVLVDRQGRIEIASEPLRHIGDAGRGLVAVRRRSHVAAQHIDRTALNAANPRDQAEQGRLADPIRADDGELAPGQNGQSQIAKSDHLPIGMLDARQADGCGGLSLHRAASAQVRSAKARLGSPEHRRCRSSPP